MSISFNPAKTTAPTGNFALSTQGFYAGSFKSNPSTRQRLEAGVVSSSAVQPFWGGLAVTVAVDTDGAQGLGCTVSAATSQANINGFTVYDQGYNATIVPGNSAPLYAQSQTINYFRLGSGAVIRVACLASLVATLESGDASQALYWDPALLQLTASGTAGAIQLPASVQVRSVNITSKVVSYSSGVASWVDGAVAEIII
jgi:hypothetical protein